VRIQVLALEKTAIPEIMITMICLTMALFITTTMTSFYELPAVKKIRIVYMIFYGILFSSSSLSSFSISSLLEKYFPICFFDTSLIIDFEVL